MLLSSTLWLLLPALVLPGLQFGQAPDTLRAALARDLSNPNAWEETRFAYAPTVTVWGLTASSVEVGF
jgi:hypothetical protein